MVASADESFHRMVIAPGEIVLKHTRLVRIEATLPNSLARVRELATRLSEDVALADSSGRTVLTEALRANRRVERFRTVSDRSELVATSREEVITELLDGVDDWSARVRSLTIKYGLD